ncbi:uncharacterized protein LOC135833203 isoform X2 [Planococcus citri]|uniref:uncharacterized protein LOC135833203 isoform X2 n=1 Tax=Planococcus citri TaxID=170843 RepID=UPI0031F82B56
MSAGWKFVLFEICILCVSTRAAVTGDKSDERSQIIVAKEGDNITLPCNPKLQNSQTLDKSAFEWVADYELPIYVNGRISPSRSLETFEPHFEVVNSSLIYRKIFRGNYTLICRLIPSNSNYTYFLQVRPAKGRSTIISLSTSVPEFAKAGEPLTLPCDLDDITPSIGINYAWTASKSNQPFEVISLNQHVILRNNTAGYRISENGSLIIPNFKPSYRSDYECHFSIGSSRKYHSYSKDNADYVRESSINIKKNIAVSQGNNVTLKCPTAVRDLVWICNGTDYLFMGGSAVKNSKSEGVKMHSNGTSLIITDFSSSLSGTYECLSRTGLKYTYDVTERKPINRTIVAKLGNDVVLPCSLSADELEGAPSFVWIRNNAELLFINEYPVVGSNIHKLKIGDDQCSLVITDFSTSLVGFYTCRWSSGVNITYHVTTPNESKFKKQTVIFPLGKKKTVLPCPATNNNEHASFEWSFRGAVGTALDSETLLSVNQEKFVSQPFNENLVIDEDNSLVILLLTTYAYGVYTCRWSTGEEYVYNVNRESVKWTNLTLQVNLGEDFTLPCPLEDPRDRDANWITWYITFQNKEASQYSGWFQFIDGKRTTIPDITSSLPPNLKFADGTKSLIFSNITSDMEGEFLCSLIVSNTAYRYEIKVLDF